MYIGFIACKKLMCIFCSSWQFALLESDSVDDDLASLKQEMLGTSKVYDVLHSYHVHHFFLNNCNKADGHYLVSICCSPPYTVWIREVESFVCWGSISERLGTNLKLLWSIKIHSQWAIRRPHSSLPIMLTIGPRLANRFCTHSPISSKHLWCLLDLHPIIHHSNRGVWLG